MTRIFLLALAALFAPATARAACTTISASGLAFGTYTGQPVTTSAASVTLGCSTGSAYSVGLNAGTGAGASVTTREMTSGGARLNYQMFQDAAYSTNWGNTVDVDARSGTAGGPSTVLNIYARLLTAQYPTPGTYTDTITATSLGGGTGNTTFSVTATVQATCTISATNLAFGTYGGVQLDGTSTITATCTNTTPYQIGFNDGANASGIAGNWNMLGASAGALLSYKLYQDAGRTVLEGNTQGTNTLTGTGSGAPQFFTVYGRIPAGQFVAPDTYTDTVNLTLYY